MAYSCKKENVRRRNLRTISHLLYAISSWSSSPFLKDHEHAAGHQGKASQIVPFQLFLQIDNREDAEHNQCDHFLYRLQLCRRKLIVPDPIGRNLETILDEGSPPS